MKPSEHQQDVQMKVNRILCGMATILWVLDLSDQDTLAVPIAVEQEDGSWLLYQQVGRRKK